MATKMVRDWDATKYYAAAKELGYLRTSSKGKEFVPRKYREAVYAKAGLTLREQTAEEAKAEAEAKAAKEAAKEAKAKEPKAKAPSNKDLLMQIMGRLDAMDQRLSALEAKAQ